MLRRPDVARHLTVHHDDGSLNVTQHLTYRRKQYVDF
jgi:hypothetical protein